MDFDLAVRGFTIADENGDFSVYINARYCFAQQERTLRHELNHIRRGDFDRTDPAHLIERGA